MQIWKLNCAESQCSKKGAIPAGVPLAVTDFWDANLPSVVAAEVDSLVGIQPLPQREQGLCRCLVLFLQIDLCQPALQTLIANIVGLTLADYCPKGAGDHSIRHQDVGQEREILSLDCVLESDAGCGNKNGLYFQSTAGLEIVEHCSSYQVSISFADPCSGITQSDGVVQHGIQHTVAQNHLLRPLRHVLGGKQLFKDVVYLVLGVLPVF